MSMACQKIVAEPLTITGSIGVVAGKISLAELYAKIG
jgi:protease-4